MSDKNVTNSNDPVEKIEYFEDKLHSECAVHMGFDSVAKAADLSLCDRSELALGDLSDRELERELARLQDYLELPPAIYYSELLKAAQQRLRFLSASLKRYESKEVFGNEEESRSAHPSLLNLRLNDVLTHPGGGTDFLGGQPHPRPGMGRPSLGEQAGGIGIAPEILENIRKLAPAFSNENLQYHDIGFKSRSVNIHVSGEGAESLIKDANLPEQPYLVQVGTMLAYNHPTDGLLVTDNFMSTRRDVRNGLEERSSVHARIKTLLDRLCFHVGALDSNNLAHVAHKMVTKHNASGEGIFVMIRAAKVGQETVDLQEAEKVYQELKVLVDIINPPYGQAPTAQKDFATNFFKTIVVPFNENIEKEETPK